MKKIIIIFLLIIFTSNSQAEDTKRISSITLNTNAGTNQYRSLELDGLVGLNKDWQLDLRANSTKNDPNSKTSLIQFGANVIVSPNVSVRLAVLNETEPNDVKATGFTPGITWILSDLWQAERQTKILFDYTFTRYRQPVTVAKRTVDTNVYQSEYSFGLAQEILETLSANLNYSVYKYKPDAAKINKAINARPALINTIAGIVVGLPQNSASLGLSFYPGKHWTFDINTGRSNSVDSKITNSLGLGIDYSINDHWLVGGNFSHSTTTATAPITIGGFLLTYTI